MQIAIAYREIQLFILREFKKEIGMKYVNPHTLSLSFAPYRLMPTLRADLSIQEVNETTIVLSYNSRRGINLIIRGLVAYMDESINQGIIYILTDKRLIYVQLDAINGMPKALEYLEPKDIRFAENGVIADLKVKG